MFIYKCQKCGEPAVIFGDYVSCANCGHIIPKSVADYQELFDACNWLANIMHKDSKVWIAIRRHNGSIEWAKKLHDLLKMKG